MIYVASPYTADFQTQILNFEEAERFVTHHLKLGEPVFSPIVYCHAISLKYHLPGDADFWRQFNESMLISCNELWVLRLPGWDKSVGVRREIEFSEAFNIRVSYHDPIRHGQT